MITESTIQEATRRLVEAYQPLAVYLFGSYAWGTPTEDSDLDFMVIMPDEVKEEKTQLKIGSKALLGLKTPIDFVVLKKNNFTKSAKHPSSLSHLVQQKGIITHGVI